MAVVQTKMIKPAERRTNIHSKINRTPVNLDSIEALTPETDRKVTGTFINVETPGQTAPICVGNMYKGMPYFNMVLHDGERYTIPLSVARHINERCLYSKHTYLLDEAGNPLKSSQKIPRYKFTAEF